MFYIDIHTHKKTSNQVSIINCLSNFKELSLSGFYSAGIHPWYINSETEKQFIELKEVGKQKNILAIGECGLDKIYDTNFALQQTYFIKQIQLVNELSKPLIIHCVRAFNEVVQILQGQKAQVPVIFHGFSKNQTLADELIRKGYYLSFGKHLFKDTVAETFKSIPIERFFLETDNSELEIEAIYKQAAFIKNISIETLIKQLSENAEKVFSHNFTE